MPDGLNDKPEPPPAELTETTKPEPLGESPTSSPFEDVEASEVAPAKTPVENWNRMDGQMFHEIVQDDLEDRVSDPDNGVLVFSNLPTDKVNDQGETIGRGQIDSMVETNDKIGVVDYKTDQMNDWTPAHSTKMGTEYGNQVKEYVNGIAQSSDKPVEGHLLMVGQKPETIESRSAFEEAAKAAGVSTVFTKTDGSPHAVANEVVDHLGLPTSDKPAG